MIKLLFSLAALTIIDCHSFSRSAPFIPEDAVVLNMTTHLSETAAIPIPLYDRHFALRPPTPPRAPAHTGYIQNQFDSLTAAAGALKGAVRLSFLSLRTDSFSLWTWLGLAIAVVFIAAAAYVGYRYLKWRPEKKSYREVAKSRSYMLDSGVESAGSPQNKSAYVVYVSPGESSPDGVKRKSKYKTRRTASMNNSAEGTTNNTPAGASR